MADNVAGLGLQGILVALSQRQPRFVVIVEEARGHHLLGAENSRCQPLVGMGATTPTSLGAGRLGGPWHRTGGRGATF